MNIFKFQFFFITLAIGQILFGKTTSNDSAVVLYFTGDVTLSNHFESHVDNQMDYAFKKLNWFADADISMVNLENPLTSRGTPTEKLFTFRARPDYADILIYGGVDIVTIANNHIYDYGAEGVFDTVENLSKKNIHHVGAGRTINEARHPVIFYIKGHRIAYFAYYGTHKHSDSHPAMIDSAGTAPRQLPIIKEDIEKYRDSVDFIIINFHWGIEKADYPEKDQIDFAHSVIDYGADIIVGHHPHVLQGVELYKGKIIAYSLGNFIFGGNSRISYDTAVLKIEIDTSNKVKAAIIPIEVNYWQPVYMNEAKGKLLIEKVEKLSSKFTQSIF